MILVVPFNTYEEWKIFVNFTSKYFIRSINDHQIKTTFLLFPDETVSISKINDKQIKQLDLYAKQFFSKNKLFIRFDKHFLLKQERKNLKNRNGKVLYLLPTFFFEPRTITHFLSLQNRAKTIFVYPKKFIFRAEAEHLLKTNGTPFYYFQNNEFNKSCISKRKEYIYLSKKFLFIASREYHPLLFDIKSFNFSETIFRKRKDFQEKGFIYRDLSRFSFYKLVQKNKESTVDKIANLIDQNLTKKPFEYFSLNNKHLHSLLFKQIRKAIT